ncbi:MAG: exonuclease SbcCD subunit D C-terminal domain-containing protein [Tannerellaceae bacterium]|jgi:exonuclease SbcD|nr:exonuclease SbcCD subunit D C-terminal domain-containing protein [Tannerellaceae bacterium]
MSLRIIHTADWHLGQTFFGYEREEEHEAFLTWLVDTLAEQQTDVLLIAGDVFDVANPSASAQRRFFRFLREANKRNPTLQIIIIAGNHDSAARLEAPAPLLEELNTFIIGTIRRTKEGIIDYDSLLIPLYDPEGNRKAWCMAVPFLRQGDYPPAEETQSTYVDGIGRMYRQLYKVALSKQEPGEAIIAMGHLHTTGAELSEDDRSERIIMGGLESVPVDSFDSGIAYTALGHIHKAQRVGSRNAVRYSGSPLPMSFSEANYRHQVVSVIIDEKETRIEPIPIPKTVELLRIPPVPAPLEEVLEKLSSLPDLKEGEIPLTPFLEVRVLLSGPDPALRHKIEESIKGKAVRLTSITSSYPKQGKDEQLRPLTYSDLQTIDPLYMLKHTYTSRYGEGLPEELEELFNEVVREVTA